MQAGTALRGRANAFAVSSRCERLRRPRERPAAVAQSVSVIPGDGVLKQRFSTKPASSSHSRLPSSISSLQELEPLKKQKNNMAYATTQSWRSLFGAASLLGCGAVALAVGLVALSSSETLTEAADGEDPVVKGSPEQGGKASDQASSKPPIVPSSKALRKRKTSNGRERFVISSAAVRGDRPKMEDTSFISDCKRFAAVYDGHGGAAVSDYLRKHYFSMLVPELTKLDEERAVANIDMLLSHAANQMSPPPPPPTDSATPVATSFVKRNHILDILKTSMEKLDVEIARKNEWKYQGSTAVGVLLYEDVIYTINVGDCRAVMCRSGDAVELTRDHKPNDPSEQSRIESLGGTVKWHGYVDAQGEPIEPYGAYRINGNLAVARAIGDRDLRPFVSGEPEVKAFKRDENRDEFIVIASDGLWDVFTSEEVVTFVKDVMSGELGGRESWRSGGHSDTRVPIFEWSQQYRSDRSMIKAARKRRKMQIANYLVQEALYRGTSDNVSVIVVWLR